LVPVGDIGDRSGPPLLTKVKKPWLRRVADEIRLERVVDGGGESRQKRAAVAEFREDNNELSVV
jgi:hypothetical protein